jgi:hypothetical protein
MEAGGNKRVNEAFEAKLPACSSSSSADSSSANKGPIKPNPKSDLEVRDQFFKAKFQKRAFFDPSKYRTKEKKQKLLDPNQAFLGMSAVDLFSASKVDLFHMVQHQSQNGGNKIGALGGLSHEDFLLASREDLVSLLVENEEEASTVTSNSARSTSTSTAEQRRRQFRLSQVDDDDHNEQEEEEEEFILALKDSESQEQEAGSSASSPPPSPKKSPSSSGRPRSRRISSSFSKSATPEGRLSRRKSDTTSKSPTCEGRSSSRGARQRARRSRVLPPSGSTTSSKSPTRPSYSSRLSPSGSEESKTANSGSRSSSQRSTSRSKRSHVRESSSNRMRRSQSGSALEKEDATSQPKETSSSSRMRRSGSGSALEREGTSGTKASSSNRMRRSGSGSALEREASSDAKESSSNRMRRSGSGSALAREEQPSMRRSSSGASLEKGSSGRARTTRRSGSGNSLDEQGSTHSKMRRSGSGVSLQKSSSKSMRRSVNTGNSSTVLKSKQQSDEGASDAHNEEFEVVPPNGTSLVTGSATYAANLYSLEEFTTSLAGHEEGEEMLPLSEDSSPRGRSQGSPPSRTLSGHRSLSRSNSAHESDDANSETRHRSTSRQNSSRNLGSGKERRKLYRGNSLHDLRSPPSRQKSDCEKSVNPTIPLSLPRHLKRQSSLDPNAPRPFSRLSRTVSMGSTASKEEQKDDNKHSVATLENEKPTFPRKPRRRDDPLASRSEHVSRMSRTVSMGGTDTKDEQKDETKESIATFENENKPALPRKPRLREDPLSSRSEHIPRSRLGASAMPNSLSSASTHNSQAKRKTYSGGNSKQVFSLFATSTESSSKTTEDCETEGTISCSSDGATSAPNKSLSAAARRAIEELKALSK